MSNLRGPTRGWCLQRRIDLSAIESVAARSRSEDRRAGEGRTVRGLAIMLVGMLLTVAPPAFPQSEPVLAIAVGDPGSPSYQVGLGVSSLLRAQALPDGTRMRPEMWESLSPEDRMVVLSEEAQLAVIGADEAERQPARDRELARAALGLADGSRVLVRADLSDDLVHDLTQLMLEHADLIQAAYPEAGDLEPAASFERIAGTVHPGALRYYEEHSSRQAAALPEADRRDPDPAANDGSATASLASKSFTVYFDFDDPDFDFKQIGVVQEACGYAATLPAAEFILSGHADTVGPEPYNDGLSLARAQSVASVIRNDSRFRDALNVIRFGEKDLAVPTGDEVGEPKNRRVVITVVSGEVDEAMLREIEASAARGADTRSQR